MASFNEIHGPQLDRAKGKLRVGEIWNVHLRDTLMAITEEPMPAELYITIVRFRAAPNGYLEPASPSDRLQIEEWERRHRNTPPESFGLQMGFSRHGQGVP